jgi:hypothetical protein
VGLGFKQYHKTKNKTKESQLWVEMTWVLNNTTESRKSMPAMGQWMGNLASSFFFFFFFFFFFNDDNLASFREEPTMG